MLGENIPVSNVFIANPLYAAQYQICLVLTFVTLTQSEYNHLHSPQHLTLIIEASMNETEIATIERAFLGTPCK